MSRNIQEPYSGFDRLSGKFFYFTQKNAKFTQRTQVCKETDLMINRPDPLSRNVEIINDLGLHARSAAKIAMIAQKAKSDVQIIRDRESVDAKSIIDMLTLACAKGTKIAVRVDSDADREILNEIVSLVEDGFGE